LIQGSASKTGRVKRIQISGAATAQAMMPVQLIRRSSAPTLTSAILTAISAAKHDVNDPAATMTVSSVGTANLGALGTANGTVGVGRVGMPPAAAGPTGQAMVWEFATRQDKAIILRGTSDFLCINFAGVTVPSGGVLDFEIEIEEDNS
jgi:hypothetical protein